MNSEKNFKPSGALGLLAMLFVAVAQTALGSSSLILEGQNKGDTIDWYSVNLQNWLELDYIPCRVHATGYPAGSQITVTIDFPHLNGSTPGFQNLYTWTN